jgi:hypothetical protein
VDHIDFEGSFLLSIPSEKLKELHINNNNLITDEAIIEVDQKWPDLNSITIRKCLLSRNTAK